VEEVIRLSTREKIPEQRFNTLDHRFVASANQMVGNLKKLDRLDTLVAHPLGLPNELKKPPRQGFDVLKHKLQIRLDVSEEKRGAIACGPFFKSGLGAIVEYQLNRLADGGRGLAK
jgi:hypothetical protein